MTQSTGRRLGGLGLVALGVVAGYTAAVLQHRHPAQVAEQRNVDATSNGLFDNARTDPDLALVEVTSSTGERLVTALVGDPPVVVLPARFVARSARMTVRSATGSGAADTVVAARVETDLVAVAAVLPAPVSLPVTREQGSLYLGREFALPGGTGAAGWVDSAARRTELGGYVYEARVHDPSARGGVLMAPGSRRVIGLAVTPADAEGRFDAVDAAALADLLDGRDSWPPTDLDGLRAWYYHQSPAGRLTQLEQLVAAEQWQSIVDSAALRISLGGYPDRTARLLDTAYGEAARQRAQEGHTAEALALLDEAGRLLGLSASRALLRADLAEGAGNLPAAVDALLAAIAAGAEINGVRTRLRLMVAGAVSTGVMNEVALIALIGRAETVDPNHAVYPRLAGELLLGQGRPAEAVAALERARQLDPAMAAEIDALLNTAEGRLQNPSQVSVPVAVQGEVLIVQARLNGQERPYRFVLDTGASYTAVSLRTALELGIRAMFTGAPTVALETANGRVYADVVNLESVALGQARASNVQAVILESIEGVDGLLGQSFLNRFDVQIRPGDDRILLSPR